MSIIGNPEAFQGAIDVLSKLKGKFVFSTVVRTDSCGTSACAMGWLALLDYKPVTTGWPALDVPPTVDGLKNVADQYLHTAQIAFGISQVIAILLFSPENEENDFGDYQDPDRDEEDDDTIITFGLPEDARLGDVLNRMREALKHSHLSTFTAWCAEQRQLLDLEG